MNFSPTSPYAGSSALRLCSSRRGIMVARSQSLRSIGWARLISNLHGPNRPITQQCLKPEFRSIMPNCMKPASGHLPSCVAHLRSFVRKCGRSLGPGRSSHLVDLTRHCVAVRPRRRGTTHVADITRRTAGGRSAGLLARPWTTCGEKCWRHLTIACGHDDRAVVPLRCTLLTVRERDVNVIYIH